MTTSSTIRNIKEWVTLVVSFIACIAAVIFWVQQADNHKFEHIDREITGLRSDVNKIRDNNNEILRIIGRLEGKLERRTRN
jgi:hypothetical protein